MRNFISFLTIGSVCSFVFYALADTQTRAESVGQNREQKVGTIFISDADPSTSPSPSPTASPSPSPTASPAPTMGGVTGSPVMQPVTTGQEPGSVPAAQPAPSGGAGMMPGMMPMGAMGAMGAQPQSASNRRSGRAGTYVCFNDEESPCKCENVATIAEAIKEAQEFHALCVEQGVIRSPNRLMAINDYRGRVGCMYLIDVNTGQCDYATTSDYGTGSGVPPRPGCTSGSHMTPAGFHLTRPHNGERYDESNSLGLMGLQGQMSGPRAILIHQGKCRGGAATWGCSGVGNYPEVRKRLGRQGTLVYNYFGDEVGNCRGVRNKKSCRPESGVYKVREGDSGDDVGTAIGRDSVE